jgi:hypothetical protein
VVSGLNGCGRDPGTAAATTSEPKATPTNSRSGEPSSDHITDVPEADRVVTGFYDAVARGDVASAEAYLAPEFWAEGLSAADFSRWVSNFVKIEDVQVVSPRHILDDTSAQYPGFTQLSMVLVNYTATVRSIIANDDNGPTSRFVLLGLKAPGGSWSILSIATGP